MQADVIVFVVSVMGKKAFEIYITGDTTFYEGAAAVARRFNPQYVFVFAGAAQVRRSFNVTMSTNDAINTPLAFLNATIIPLHYEGWKHYTQNVNDIKTSFQILGIDQRLKMLEAGLPVLL